ncbi:MAG: hypothetical protein RMJ59_00430 [Candidatus Nitrosocaldus sp.]|nr:hypothetical protein [Candidatus Nitrosocaldus sp.]MDW8274829.1 hypothetical protein [Candidatus Nitrosocaldus sp.]
MQYHEAVQIGQERARRAQYKLFEYTGFAYLLKTVKRRGDVFEPVGDENLVKVERIGDDGYIIALCDADGYVKAQSRPLKYEEARRIYERMLDDGFGRLR